MLGSAKKFIETNFNVWIFLFLVICIMIYLFEVIVPFFIAFIIAYLTNPLKIYLDKRINKTLSSFLSIITFVLCFLSIVVLILPIIIHQIQNLILLLPGYLAEIENLFKEINTKYLFSEKIKIIDYTTLFKPVARSLLDSGDNLISNSIGFLSGFFNIILIVVISFYLSLEFNKIKNFIYSFDEKSRFIDFPQFSFSQK